MMVNEEEQQRKRAIFEAMSPRRQQKILKKGYDTWDPFLPPKEPSRFFKDCKAAEDENKGEAYSLFYSFLEEHSGQTYSKEYLSGAKDICSGLYRGDERYRGMCAFCCWMTARKEREEK